MTEARPTPVERYRRDLEANGLTPDAAQQRAVEHTQALYQALIAENRRRSGLLHRLRRRLNGNSRASFKGLYFWGGVGRGKTMLVDAFFEALPFQRKLRLHFHRFMQQVHRDLRELRDLQEPLRVVADRFGEKAIVICFDEFHVSDITDAMLLKGLLEALFERGITLVATSNQPPDRLYHGGLQRERFLPAIALLQEYTDVVNVDSGIDYRMRYLDQAETYHHPLSPDTDELLRTHFTHLAPNRGRDDATIEIEGRKIQTRCRSDGVVWFDFPAICEGPRGAADYIEIARQFQTVLVGNIQFMADELNDTAKRFINLVDEFYDRNVRLIVTAARAPEELYGGRRHSEEFRRTASRLTEMQSLQYLARPHRVD